MSALLVGAALTATQSKAQSASDSLVKTSQRANAAAMQTMQIPSHGALMNALVYVAAGAGPHPAVILLHGFPGNEKNLDLAQDIRRAGWDVLYFNYRGSWGTPGDFSFSHGIEDVSSALAYLRRPEVAKELRLDPAHIVLIGHSMGGFMAVEGAAADPAVTAFATISAGDMDGFVPANLPKEHEQEVIQKLGASLEKEGMAPLAGCTPQGLARDLVDHAAQWRFDAKADALKNRTALIITSDDGLADANIAFASKLQAAGDKQVTTLHLATDHSYSDQRLELSKAVLLWLAALPR